MTIQAADATEETVGMERKKYSSLPGSLCEAKPD